MPFSDPRFQAIFEGSGSFETADWNNWISSSEISRGSSWVTSATRSSSMWLARSGFDEYSPQEWVVRLLVVFAVASPKTRGG